MIEEHLKELRAMLEQAENLPAETRTRLLDHVEAIAEETLSSGQASPAESQAHHGVGKLVGAIEEIEASHPEITALINRIAGTAANIGI